MSDNAEFIAILKKALGEASADTKLTAEGSLSYGPVWYAVSKIGSHIGRLPLNLHKQSGRVKSKVTDHPLYKTMRVRSNRFQTPIVFRRLVMTHALLWGNGRAYIHRDESGVELLPLHPDRTVTLMMAGEKVHVANVGEDDRLYHLLPVKPKPHQSVVFYDSDVLHVPGLGVDGVEGLMPYRVAAQSWSTGIGAETHVSKQQTKGYSGGLILEAPADAFRKEDEAREFLKHFREQHAGAENTGKIGMLRGGITAKVLSQTNSDAQAIEHRRFNRQDAALWFLLESIIGDDNSVSYNSLEQKVLAYLQNCLSTWLTIWEEECDSKLLTDKELRRGFYFKFADGALLRTDKQTTATVISTLIASRVINPNEARDMLDMNPYDGGDEFANPAVTPGSGAAAPQTKNELALRVMLGDLIKTESAMCRQAAASRKNFMTWMEKWYAGWEEKFAEKLIAVGGTAEMAVKHCDRSKELLLAACECQPDELAESVAKCVGSWCERVEELLEELSCVAS